jgi:hypothetical protein
VPGATRNPSTGGCALAEIHLFPVSNHRGPRVAHRNLRGKGVAIHGAPNSASDQLKQYLSQLAPQVRWRLLAELERLHMQGEDLPRLEELITSLRTELIAAGHAQDRIGNPGRYFFQPLDAVLVDRAPESANSGQIARGSLGPIWDILTEELLSTMARSTSPRRARRSMPTTAGSRQLAVAFRKKVLGLGGTIRSAEGVAKQGLKKYEFAGLPDFARCSRCCDSEALADRRRASRQDQKAR